jgi:hypothetical protein
MTEPEHIFTHLFIRGTHPDVFRSGQWGKVVQIGMLPKHHGDTPRDPRPVFLVEFIDGQRDLWPVYDPAAGYEFSAVHAGYDVVAAHG